jgi:hypothetical protein
MSLTINGLPIGVTPTGFYKCADVIDALFPHDARDRRAAHAAMEVTYVDDLDSIMDLIENNTKLTRADIKKKLQFGTKRPRRSTARRGSPKRKRALPVEEEEEEEEEEVAVPQCAECGVAPPLMSTEKHCRKCFFEHTATPHIERLEQRVKQLEGRRAEAAVARVLDRYHNTLYGGVVDAEVALHSAPSERAWTTLRDFLARAHALLDEAPEQRQVLPDESAWEQDVQELRELAQRIGSLANALQAVADTPSVRSELVVSMDGYVTRARRLCMRATEPAFGVSERLRHLGCDPARYDAKEIGRRALELFRLRYPGREPARRFSPSGDYWFNVYTESECPFTLDAAILKVV